MPARNFIEAVAKAFAVLEILGDNKRGLTLQQLTSELGMVKSSVFRLLYTLESLGYVRRQGPCYLLGMRCIAAGKLATAQFQVHDLAVPYMEALRDELGETVNLGVVDGDEVLYIAVVESANAFRLVNCVGHRSPFNTVALGKCLAAYLPLDRLRQIVDRKGLPSRTANTITTFDALLTELKRVRAQGYAVDNQEVAIGTRCIAAPIFSGENQVVAAMSVSAPEIRMPVSRDEAVALRLREVCGQISRALGYESQETALRVLREARDRQTVG